MKLKVLVVWCALFGLSYGMVADLYLNKDKFGEYFKLEISEKGCTNVPLNWENQAVSVDTHGSCIKFYDLPYCRGKYVALQPYHGTFQDNLQTLGFNKIISSASPCGPKVPTGRYYIQNGADGSVLTVETRNGTPVAHAHAFKPYISKGQQFQIEKVALADYEIIPRVQQNRNPLTFDMSISTSSHPVRRIWKIESVYRGRYLIKNDWNNKCLYKADNGRVEEHDCVAWSPNQEWVFRSIKVKPYFPSKEELNKKPLRPDDKLPFEPQDDAFSSIPYRPAHIPDLGQFNYGPPLPPGASVAIKRPAATGQGTGSGKKQIQIQRPGPVVINPGEAYPPVFPYPILPSTKRGVKKPENKAPPVPQIRHPGPLPFPAEPVVTDPRKPVVFSPFDTYNLVPNATQTTPKPTKSPLESDEDEDDEDRDSDEQYGEDSGERDEGVDEDRSEEQRDQGRPQENNERDKFQDDGGNYDEEFNSDEVEEDRGNSDRDYEEEDRPPQKQRIKHQKQKEASAGINYSDFRLFF